MRKPFLALAIASLFAASCAGIQVPGTDYRFMDWRIESSRQEVNSTCIDQQQLTVVAGFLEKQHLRYLRTRNEEEAITTTNLLASLGQRCRSRFSRLSIPQIKTELFGDIQTIADSNQLRELGGLAFDYQNVATRSGIEISLHVREADSGPSRRIVAIYRLSDEKVIHFNYSGTDNVDRKSRSWPIDQFFGNLIGVGIKAIIP